MIKKRDLQKNDREYITRSVLMSFLAGSAEIKKINKDSYLRSHNETVNGLIDNCEVIIMCDNDETGLIYGFALFQNLEDLDILHYIYVRRDFRGRGICAQMLEHISSADKTCTISHLTDDFKPAKLKKYWSKVIYDPYARLIAFKK